MRWPFVIDGRVFVAALVSAIAIATVAATAIMVIGSPPPHQILGSYRYVWGGDGRLPASLMLKPDGVYVLCQPQCAKGRYSIWHVGGLDYRITFHGGPMAAFYRRVDPSIRLPDEFENSMSDGWMGIDIIINDEKFFFSGCFMGRPCTPRTALEG